MRLGEFHYSAKERALNIIELPDFYTKDDVRTVYEELKNDGRLSPTKRNEIVSKLIKIYRNK